MKITIELDGLKDVEELRRWLNAKESALEEQADQSIPTLENLLLGEAPTNALMKEGITTVEQLIKLRDIDLLKLPSFGRKSLNKIKDALSEFNLKLSD